MMKNFILTLACVAITLYAYPQWTQTNGPAGNFSRVVKVADYLFVSSEQGGIYRSADKGKNWKPVNNGLPRLTNSDFTSSGTNIYVSLAGGVYYSEDFGENWIAINNGIENTINYNLFVNGNDIWAGDANGGLNYSSDHGATWTKQEGPVPNRQVHEMGLVNGKLYACSTGPVFVSEDKGATWALAGFSPSYANRTFVNGNSIYIAEEAVRRIHISHDGGVTWTLSSEFGSSVNRNTAKAISAVGDIIFVCGSAGDTFISQDNGQTWGQLHTDVTYSMHNDMVKEGFEIFLATSDGFYYSGDDGSHWENRSKGLRAGTSEFLLLNDTILVAAGTAGLHTSNDGGDNWKTEKPDLGGYFEGVYAEGLAMVVANGVFIIQTTNGGLSWIRREQTPSSKYIGTVNGNNERVMATVNGSGVYLSEDNGTSWTFKTHELLESITSVESSYVYGDTLIVSGVSTTGETDLLISSDFGDNWRSAPLEPNYFYAKAYSFVGSELYVGSTNNIYSTSDLGVTAWERKTTSRPNNVFSFNAINDTTFVATTDGTSAAGVLITYDRGTTWFEVGQENVRPTSSVVKGDHLFMASWGQGIWKVQLDQLNGRPVINKLKEQLGTRQGQGITLTTEDFEISDPEGDALTIAIEGGENYTVDGATVLPEDDFVGSLTVRITVNDGHQTSTVFQFQIEVFENVRPEIVGIDEEFLIEKNSSVTIPFDKIIVVDPDDTEITFEVLPGENYTVSGDEVSPDTDFTGDLTVGIVANDGFQDSEVFNITMKVTELITGVFETSPQRMTIYPIPADKTLFINVTDIHEDHFVIQDAMGREVVSDRLTPRSINKVDLADVPSGMYFLKVPGQKIVRFGKR